MSINWVFRGGVVAAFLVFAFAVQGTAASAHVESHIRTVHDQGSQCVRVRAATSHPSVYFKFDAETRSRQAGCDGVRTKAPNNIWVAMQPNVVIAGGNVNCGSFHAAVNGGTTADRSITVQRFCSGGYRHNTSAWGAVYNGGAWRPCCPGSDKGTHQNRHATNFPGHLNP